MKLSEELNWRGFVNQTTFKNISALDEGPLTFYWGVDPSASSLTIGNLATAMMVRHFIGHGHKAVLLVGGATGMIGDPDGKTEERALKSLEEIESNKKAIARQYGQVFEKLEFTLVDNYSWFKNITFLDFLRNVGKHVPMRQMLGRDFVQARLNEGGAGISYAEFSYSLIQGYDFLHLFREMGVTLQVCGSDQWGNSIAGVELIRRIAGQEAHVWSAPLVINKLTGKKFGKSEDGAVWLDENLTSVYKFYQFWLNSDDSGVEEYLKIFTLLGRDEIERIMNEFRSDRSQRLAQKTLAYEVTKLVHGQERAVHVQNVTAAVFKGDFSAVFEEDLEELKSEIPVVSSDAGDELVDLLVSAKLANSRTEARRFLQEGAVYINGTKATEAAPKLADEDFRGKYCLLRRGKNQLALVER